MSYVKFGPSCLRKGKESKELRHARTVGNEETGVEGNRKSYSDFPFFMLTPRFARPTHGTVEFHVRAVLDRRQDSTAEQTPEDVENDATVHDFDNESYIMNEIEEEEEEEDSNEPGFHNGGGFQGLFLIDTLNSAITVSTLASTWSMKFKVAAIKIVDKVKNNKIRIVFEQDYSIGCLGWTSKSSRVWSFRLGFKSDRKRDFACALLQGLKGHSTVLTTNGSSLVANKETCYVGRRKIKIWIGTWNMGSAAAPESLLNGHEFLSAWIGHREPNQVLDFKNAVLDEDELEHDLYAFGFQESHNSIYPVIDAFMKKYHFTQVGICKIGRIGQVIYVREAEAKAGSVHYVEKQSEALGIMGVGTNKGSAAIGMLYKNQPLLFITSHLQARASQTRLRERNQQLRNTIRRLTMGLMASSDVLKKYTTFWLGDLNYRILSKTDYWPDEDLHRDDVIDMLTNEPQSKHLELFHSCDQLSIEKDKGQIFSGFKEDLPEFLPTYKYKPFTGKTQWDPVENGDGDIVGYFAKEIDENEHSKRQLVLDVGEDSPVLKEERAGWYYVSLTQMREYRETKGQCPSWCDRVLYRALPSTSVKQTQYNSLDSVLSSDHAPVSAAYEMQIPKSQTIMRNSKYRVGLIQLLDVEVITLRDPRVSIKQLFPLDDYVAEGERPSGFYEQGSMNIMEKAEAATEAFKRAIIHQNRDKLRRKKYRQDTMSTIRKSTRMTVGGKKSIPGKKSFNAGKQKKGSRFFPVKKKDTSNTQIVPPKKTTKVSLDVESAIGLMKQESSASLVDEDVDEVVEEDLQKMPHVKKLFVALQAPFLDRSCFRKVVTSLESDSNTPNHTFLPMKPPYQYGKIGEECEFKWDSADLSACCIGPFLTTCEYLSSQHIVLHLVPRKATRGFFNDSVGSCTLRLNEATFGEVTHFEEELTHLGSFSGLIRGRFRILWDDSGWEDPSKLPHQPLYHSNVLQIPIPFVGRTQQEHDSKSKKKLPDIMHNQKVEPILYKDIKGEDATKEMVDSLQFKLGQSGKGLNASGKSLNSGSTRNKLAVRFQMPSFKGKPKDQEEALLAEAVTNEIIERQFEDLDDIAEKEKIEEKIEDVESDSEDEETDIGPATP